MARELSHRQLAGYYDRIYSSKGYRSEALSILRLARRFLGRNPRSLLDVGCGTGRHLAQFVRRLSAAGVDLNSEMLRVAGHRLGRTVPLYRGDMRRFRLNTRFDVVTCLFSAIGYMQTRRDRDLAIANFYRHLNPGGIALVEGWVLPEHWRGKGGDLVTYEDSEVRLARMTSSWRKGHDSIVEYQYLVGERGKGIRHFAETVHTPLVEAEDMLGSFRRAGFRPRILRGGTYRVRGLYIGRRPIAS